LVPANAASAVVLELAPNISLSSNYTSFVFDGSACPIGIYSGGSQALFNQYVSQVSFIQVQAQFNGAPEIGTAFGYDANNTATVDNIKVVEIIPATPPLSVLVSNHQPKVYWADPVTGGTAQLQSATNAAGPYLNVSGAASGAASTYLVPAGSAAKFFRTVWVP
jgi:hypothetical protein